MHPVYTRPIPVRTGPCGGYGTGITVFRKPVDSFQVPPRSNSFLAHLTINHLACLRRLRDGGKRNKKNEAACIAPSCLQPYAAGHPGQRLLCSIQIQPQIAGGRLPGISLALRRRGHPLLVETSWANGCKGISGSCDGAYSRPSLFFVPALLPDRSWHTCQSGGSR